MTGVAASILTSLSSFRRTVRADKMRVQTTDKARGLWVPAPFKVMYGGRGGAKSWDIARALLSLGMNRPLFILCARDIQKSIKESVKKLLEDQIALLGYGGFYQPLETEIRGINGTRFVFAGLRNNILNLKSMEAIDICWVTEAVNIVQNSWEVLIPTIRRDPPFGPFGQGSEIWLDFNPELIDDYTYKYWVAEPPPGTVVIECNYDDNPWFPQILRQQMEYMKTKDYDSYLTVWGGKPRRTLKGAIFANELALAIEEGRVAPEWHHVKNKPVIVTFDLGRADMTAWWAWQQIGTDHYAVDHYENCGHDIHHYLNEIDQRKFLIKQIWLPHDAEQHHQSAKTSIKRQVQEQYPGKVKVIPRIRIATQISHTRALFPRVHVCETTCQNGLQALTRYKFGVNPETGQRSKEPLHDWASHSSSAFMGYATGLKEGVRDRLKKSESDTDDEADAIDRSSHGEGWMQ